MPPPENRRADLARALIRPRTVALIGASDDPAKNTGRPQRFLAKHGFSGTIAPVNPGRDTVQGVAAYGSLADVPGPVDQAFVMVPATAVPGVIRDCAAKGVPIATIYSDGFAKGGPEGAARQREIVEIARDAKAACASSAPIPWASSRRAAPSWAPWSRAARRAASVSRTWSPSAMNVRPGRRRDRRSADRRP